MVLRQCQRVGCGQTYEEDENTIAACVHHQGGPVFHEGRQWWSCCPDKKVSSFDEFLAITGCTTGSHSSEKVALAPVLSEQQQRVREAAVQPVKQVAKDAEADKAIKPAANIPPRPEHHNSLASTSTKMKENTPFPIDIDLEQDPQDAVPSEGTRCKRSACTATYSREMQRNDQECCFHAGVPIFHEGSKGYSCCKPRVLEFEEFLKLPGCSKNRHLFVGREKEKVEETLVLRTDHYQTPTQVIVSIFGKGADKTKSRIEFDHWEIEYDLYLPNDKRGQKRLPLFGPILPEKSTYKILSTKAELTLYKADGRSWPTLEHTLDITNHPNLTFGTKFKG